MPRATICLLVENVFDTEQNNVFSLHVEKEEGQKSMLNDKHTGINERNNLNDVKSGDCLTIREAIKN